MKKSRLKATLEDLKRESPITSLQSESDSPSSESVISEAEQVDAMAEEAPRKAKLKTKAGPKQESYQGGRIEPLAPRGTPTTELPPDPEFIFMISSCGDMGISFMRDSLHLREPGDLTRRKIGEALARLVNRIQPMQAGPLADVVTIAGYLGVWVLTGKDDDSTGRTTDTATTGNNG